MKLFFFIFIFISLTSCSKVDFLLAGEKQQSVLKNKTAFFITGWDRPVLRDILFHRLGEANEKRFVLEIKANETQTKRSIGENQVALKIDYKIIVDYNLRDSMNFCPSIENKQVSTFSFTPKSSGYNFASDVLFESLLREAAMNNLDSFIDFANSALQSQKCLDET